MYPSPQALRKGIVWTIEEIFKVPEKVPADFEKFS
jgi:hypothetical protein